MCVYNTHTHIKVEDYLVGQPIGCYIICLYWNCQLGNDHKQEYVVFNGTGL
jgi:hypothetical protein